MRRTQLVLLMGSLLVGLAFVALLPPFEGFDETAHYSYIEQIAETGTWPGLRDPYSAEITEYLHAAPGALSLDARWSYHDFFAAPPETIARGRKAAHAPRDPFRPWRPATGTVNWEGQHPPLYYALLAPVFRISRGWSLERQLLLLRSVSYVIGWLGLCIVAFTPVIGTEPEPASRMNALAPALWPALMPMWFVEMGRLGNDSLIAFLIAAAAVLIPRTILDGGALRYLLLGLVCAFGLLTKATFLPFVAAILVFLCCRLWTARKSDFRKLTSWLAMSVVITILLAGWWYGEKWYRNGVLIGSYDVAHLTGKASLVSQFLNKISFSFLLSAPIGVGISFLWTGAWSFVLPPLLSELPLAVLVVIITAGYLRAISRTPPRSFEWIYLLTLVFFAAGLGWESMVLYVEHGAFAPVWYIHSLAPILAPMLASGLSELQRLRGTRPLIGALLVYPVFFLPLATGTLALYYAGCGGKFPTHPLHDFASAASCVSDPTRIIRNLAVVGAPYLALILFAIGWVLMLIGTIASVQIWTSGSARRSSADGIS